MFCTPHSLISTVQDAKRAFVNQFITDSTFKTLANNYITAQQEFANMLVDNTLEVVKYCADGAGSRWFSRTNTKNTD
jgi:hypothetical protein